MSNLWQIERADNDLLWQTLTGAAKRADGWITVASSRSTNTYQKNDMSISKNSDSDNMTSQVVSKFI